MMKDSSIQFIVALMMLSGACAFAQPPVRRQTDDRDADLIDALVADQRFKDAESVCRWSLDRHQKTSDEFALATTRLAKIGIAKLIAAGKFDAAAVTTANYPIELLLSEYPELDRSLFLEATKISVRQMAVQMDVAAAAIDISEQSETIPAMARLTRLTRDTELLIDRIRKSVPKSDSRLKDQQRLEQELLVATVSMALMQTEMFAVESPDAIAAATAAVEAAEQAQLKLPQNSQAAKEIQRMRITAVLRSGDAEIALAELLQFVLGSNQSPSPNLQALQIEILLALGRSEDAGEILNANFGSVPSRTVPSIPMDLARLRFFLTTDQTNAAANWIPQIGQRHGLYARRLAEAIALSKLDRSLTNSGATAQPAALIETRGRQLIRDGKLAEGGRMLARAADSQTDPKRAIEIVIAGAAALQKAELFQAGSIALTSVAQKHSDAPRAPSLDLQAIVMLTSGPSPSSRNHIEARLRQHLETWPESDTAPSARQWLIQLLVAKGAHIDAAVIATSLAPSQINPTSVNAFIGQWKSVFHFAGKDDLDAKVSNKANKALTTLGKHPLAVTAHRELAACYFDQPTLQSIPEKNATEPDLEPVWVNQVIKFRRDGKLDPDLRNLSDNIDEVRRRLLKDGQSITANRKRIAGLLESWSAASTEASDQALIQLWLGNTAVAIAIVDSYLKTNDKADLLIVAATLFQDSEDKSARIAAVRWWDRLAAGSQLGSPAWHRGKMASIDLLHRSGKKAEASRRAKYILLTSASLTEEQKSKYRSYQP